VDTRYLNDRLYEIPRGVRILVREHARLPSPPNAVEGACSAGVLEEVVGTRVLLDAHSDCRGSVHLSDARCHWWVLAKQGGRARRPVAREWAATGYFGLLHDGEIFGSQKGMHGGQQGLSSLFKIRLEASASCC
jgi:hypothetical protein